ncbi:MAG TPA: alpha/beta fold hydrolase [Thermomicrobiales bacterium]|nr:alpha/beta fold hydrolase [Thermomicrobiales bacterium]
MGDIQVGDVSIHYALDGAGPWLTLVHGFSQDLRIWQPQVERLAGSFRLLRIDLRGHGGSARPDGGYGPVEYATDILAVLDALEIGATHYWGTHTGAGVGLLLAVQHPERIATLVLDGAVIPGQPEPSVDGWQARAREIARDQGMPAALAVWFDDSPFFATTQRPAAHRAIISDFSGAPWLANGPALPVPDVAALLPSIRQRTLIVNGASDLPSFLTRAADLEQTIPNSRRYVIPNAGPFAAWDAPDAVTPLVAQFLDA